MHQGGGPTIFCPPGPLPLMKASVKSASSSFGRGGNCFDRHDMLSKVLTVHLIGRAISMEGHV